jgi:heme/copper-type cytochrome/quinol oxidase subunit 3
LAVKLNLNHPSQLMNINNSYIFYIFNDILFFPSCFYTYALLVLQRQEDPEKRQPHRAAVYLATHKKKAKDENKNKLVVGYISSGFYKIELTLNLNSRICLISSLTG